jgi:hypothetical protein
MPKVTHICSKKNGKNSKKKKNSILNKIFLVGFTLTGWWVGH